MQQSWRSDALRAIGIGCAAMLVSVAYSLMFADRRSDFDQLLYAGQQLLRGVDPYPLFGYHGGWGAFPLFYPLPAVVLALPFSALPVIVARAAFMGVSFGLLAWGLLRSGRNLFPLLLAEPVYAAIANAQWTPILTAAYLIPSLAWVWAAKPNFALPFLLARPTRRMTLAFVAGAGVLLGITLALQPGWIAEWLAAVRHPAMIRPLLLSPFGGFLLAAALLRWRDRDARLLFGLACVPQTLWTYNALPVLLLARDRRQAWIMAGLSWAASAAQNVAIERVPGVMKYEAAVAATLVLFYLPAVWLVLCRADHRLLALSPLRSAEPDRRFRVLDRNVPDPRAGRAT